MQNKHGQNCFSKQTAIQEKMLDPKILFTLQEGGGDTRGVGSGCNWTEMDVSAKNLEKGKKKRVITLLREMNS